MTVLNCRVFFVVVLFWFVLFSCVGSSLLRAGFLQLRRAGPPLSCGAPASHCGPFSCGAQALVAWALVVVACGLNNCDSRAPERNLSSCGAWAQLLRGMWDLPGPEVEPLSPALAGRFLTTTLPGKPPKLESFISSNAIAGTMCLYMSVAVGTTVGC